MSLLVLQKLQKHDSRVDSIFSEHLCDSRMDEEVTSNNHCKFTFTPRLLFTHKNASDPWIRLWNESHTAEEFY